MPDILIRGVKAAAIQRIKSRAKRNGRSFQSEAKRMLEEADRLTNSEFAAAASKLRDKLSAGGRKFSDSTDMIREDRER